MGPDVPEADAVHEQDHGRSGHQARRRRVDGPGHDALRRHAEDADRGEQPLVHLAAPREVLHERDEDALHARP